MSSADSIQGSVWSRLGSEVTVVEFLGQIGGPGMDAEVSKATQKLLTKQGMKFKLNTKVTAGDAEGESVKINVEAAKGGKEDVVSILFRAWATRANVCSSTLMSSLLLSVAAHTPTVWDSRMLA